MDGCGRGQTRRGTAGGGAPGSPESRENHRPTSPGACHALHGTRRATCLPYLFPAYATSTHGAAGARGCRHEKGAGVAGARRDAEQGKLPPIEPPISLAYIGDWSLLFFRPIHRPAKLHVVHKFEWAKEKHGRAPPKQIQIGPPRRSQETSNSFQCFA